MEERTLTILKNEPIYPFNDGDYSKPRHIIVEGTCEEIGFDLATLAKQDYGTKLGVYDQPIYAEARRQYLATNWPAMLERSQGVLRAYGLPDNDVVHDPTALPFDWYDAVRGRDLGADTCSAVVLPIEKSENGATFVSRNFDLMAMVLWSELFGKKPPEGAYNCWGRGVVLETRPDNGYKTILVGGQELLTPYIDGINETGLYISLFHDPWGVGDEAGPASGMSMSGVSVVQAVGMLLDTCATVEEAKKKILNNHVMHVIMCSHMIIADAVGNATIFEIDKHSQAYVFTDRKASLNPALIMGKGTPMMQKKGRVQVGADADIIVFDPETVADRATFKESCQTSAGMKHVLVNGTFLIRDEQLDTDAFPGKPVRRPIS
jgi:hypothetical protein